MPSSGCSILESNIDMMSKILTNRDTIFCLGRKHCGKRRNCLLRLCFKKLSVVDALKLVSME